jgi:uncharacterized membrane protein
MRKSVIFCLLLLISGNLALAATLQGTVYNTQLEVEPNVLVEINTIPEQRVLAQDGEYLFLLTPGVYLLTIQKNEITITEEVRIQQEGEFVFDVFLLPDFYVEDDLWLGTEDDLFAKDEVEQQAWPYWVAAVIVIFGLWRLLKVRKKYGPLGKFRREKKVEVKKTIEEHKEDIDSEPSYLENTLEIIKKHDGRISQKLLRKEMLHLSEAKVSLILTELEHKGKIEKVKKGRGNVILLKS